jgi:serine/threonine protein kinase
MSLAPGSRLGAYEVLALIGAGGMGEVYKARDTRLEPIVAITPAGFLINLVTSGRDRRQITRVGNAEREIP